MKLMDKYLVRSFLKPFGACLLIFCILVILGRFFDKMGIFTNYHAKLKDIITFLLLGLPLWLNLVLPVATLLSLLFALGQLQQQGEITALRGAGIPTLRLYAPYFSLGLVLSIISLVGGLTFIPKINARSRLVYLVRIKQEEADKYRHDHVVVAGQNHRRYTIGWLDVSKNEMRDVVMDTFDDNAHIQETLSAKVARYDRGTWTFYDGKQITYDPMHPELFHEENFNLKVVPIRESLSDFALQDKKPEDMTGQEILRQVRRLRALGVPINRELMSLHMKIALPFAHLVVIALGIPFALRSSHQGKIQTFGYALGMAFLYWGLTSTCQSLGERGNLPVWLAAWAANVLFTGVAIWMLREV